MSVSPPSTTVNMPHSYTATSIWQNEDVERERWLKEIEREEKKINFTDLVDSVLSTFVEVAKIHPVQPTADCVCVC